MKGIPAPSLDDLKKLLRYAKPGGPLIGLNPKRSFFTPIDLIPGIGPANKLNKGRKLLSSSKAYKYLGQGLSQIPGDILLLLGLTAALKKLSSGSGSPAGASPTRTKNAPSASKKSRCPPGHRWDSRSRRCVKIRR